jgi:site-specific recombinase XerD
VRVWLPAEGRTVELSTGERDAQRAEARGAQLAAELLSGKKAPPSPRRSACDRLSLGTVGANWLTAARGRLGDKTVAYYALLLDSHLSPAFPNLLDVTWESVRAYIDRRLSKVQAPTIRHELSVLRQCVEWAAEQRLIANPPNIPSVPKRAIGTDYHKRRRVKAEEYSPEEVHAFLEALPELSPEGFWVRARFEFQYETGLRSSTLDQLSVPEHWRRREAQLRLGKLVLKSRKAYVLPLTDRAREILERVAPREGLVFGAHDLRELVALAAEKSMPADKASRFAPIHLRSARASHLLDLGMPLSAVQGLLGHARASTTDRYLRTSQRATEEALRKFGLRGSGVARERR